MKPRISVIVPVYNGARFIQDALRSVCAQTVLPVEIVVADDASTDNTRDVVALFADASPVPIRVISMEKNTGGPYGPASQAFKQTSGDYICVLDADDQFVPDAFATYLSMVEADPEANIGLATSDFLMFEDGTEEVVSPSYLGRFRRLLPHVLEDTSSVGVILHPDEAIRVQCLGYAFVFKGMIARRAWETLNGPNLDYVHACDCEFVWRLVSQTSFRVRVTNRCLLRLRMTPGSMSRNTIREATELIRLFRTMLHDVRGHADLESAIRMRLQRELFDLAYAAYHQGAFGTFFSAACKLAVARFRGRRSSRVPATVGARNIVS